MTYRNKDIEKFSICNKLITRGAKGSSSDLYMNNPEVLKNSFIDRDSVNSESYISIDTVGISVNGNRNNRIKFNEDLVLSAIKGNSKIVTDNSVNRERSFNIGERELADFLVKNNYRIKYEDLYKCIWGKSK